MGSTRPRRSGATALVALVLAVAVLAMPGSGPASAAPGTPVYAPKNGAGVGHAVRPHGIGLSGDSTLFVTHLRWLSWGSRRAVAIGTAKIDDCVPNCAQGSWRNVRHERLILSRPRRACGAVYFTRAQLSGRFFWHATYRPLWCPGS